MNIPIKIMLVDDHQVILDGLSVLLPTIIDCEIIATALSGDLAIELLKSHQPEIIILDLVMPGKFNGINTAKEIKKLFPKTKILCLSMMSDAASIDAMLKAGANGYTIKNTTGDELKEAINLISQGEVYIHPTLIKFFIQGVKVGTIKKAMLLNEIDIIILQSIADGLITEEIAELVFRSSETVRSRRKKMLKRFSVSNSAELIAYALRNNLIN